MKNPEATEANLASELARWQVILRLKDWQVIASFVHHTDLPDNQCANVAVYGEDKTAVLNILWPSEIPDTEFYRNTRDWQHSLVHELIEVHCDRFKPAKDSPNFVDAEIAINLISEALLALDRRETGIIETTEPDPLLGKLIRVPDGETIATWSPKGSE